MRNLSIIKTKVSRKSLVDELANLGGLLFIIINLISLFLALCNNGSIDEYMVSHLF